MHMTFEEITQERCPRCFGPVPCAKHGPEDEEAISIIRQMHVDTVALIDGGVVYTRDGADITAEIRARCSAEIAECDELLTEETASD